ncbi:MAG: hypothetical protein WBQ68_09460 [Terriglobales bacterium]
MSVVTDVYIAICQRMNNGFTFGIYSRYSAIRIADVFRFAVFCCTVLLVHNGWCSTAVVIVRRDSITVGADSKARGIHGEEITNVCKLAVSSDMLFANDGILGDNSGWFIDVAREIMKSSHDPTSALAKFDKIMVLRLSAVATLLAISDPAYFKARINKSIYDAAFGAYGFSGARVIGQSYILEQSPGGLFLVKPYTTPFRIRPQPEERCVTGCPDGTVLPMGYGSEIGAYIHSHPGYTRTADPVAAARMFVGLEITAHPTMVGPPVEILTIDGKGPVWSQDDEGCKTGDIPKAK